MAPLPRRTPPATTPLERAVAETVDSLYAEGLSPEVLVNALTIDDAADALLVAVSDDVWTTFDRTEGIADQ